MATITFTKDQQKVIDTHNRNILVSAAAGSGKTAVLVQRIIQMIINKENPVTIDRLLVVTFTNAAASEMRERIGEAIYQAIELDPDNVSLRDQLTLLPSASIMTLHAFCLQVIRNYFYEIDLDPSFKIGDETELLLLRQEVLEETLEEFYGEEEEGFIEFVEAYGSGKSDRAIEDIILNIYRMSMSHPRPDQWMKESVSLLDIKDADTWYKSHYVNVMVDEVKQAIKMAKRQIEKGLELIEGEEVLLPMSATFIIYSEMVEALSEVIDEPKELFDMIGQLEFPRAKSAKRGTDKSLVDPVKEALASVKDSLKNLQGDYGQKVDGEFIRRLSLSYDHMKALVEVISRFKHKYDSAKSKRNLIDFNDIEHFALDILSSQTIAERYRDQYEEIMVDEYQDSNLVQETLVKSVSRESKGQPNIFMVGDMKQSIYKFRLAKPELFANKYETYTLEESLYQKIELHQNFRSRHQVLDMTNYLFRQIMSRDLGDVKYDDHAALHLGASYNIESSHYKSKVMLIDRASYGTMTAQEIEANEIAKELQKLVTMDPPILVYDKSTGTERKLKYKDIAVLLRTMSGWSEVFVDTFSDYGIPVKSHTATGYFDSIEIQTIINALTIIDNPKQDIPLLAVMKSPMFAFTGDELVTIRMAIRDMDFHSALIGFYESILGDSPLEIKVNDFVLSLKRWRKLEKELSIYELTTVILKETGYYDYVSLMIGGPQRQANLDMFMDQVYRYEASSYKGLFDFIRYMAHVKKHSIDYGMAEILENSADQVTVMSIHKSKGLEFPVVIVGAMNKQFNRMDLNQSVLMHQELGFATDTILAKERVKYPSPIKRVLRSKMDTEMKSEELRILYVALTRAREKLIMVGSIKDSEAYLTKWCKIISEKEVELDVNLVKEGRTYLDYVMMGLMRHKEMAKHYSHLGYDYKSPIELGAIAPDIEVEIVSCMEGTPGIEHLVTTKKGDDSHAESEIPNQSYDLSRFEWIYPYTQETSKHISQSVSELKKNELETTVYTGPVLEEPSYKPTFITGERPLTGAQKGTIFHKVMDQLDFNQDYDKGSIQALFESLSQKGVLTKEELQSVYYKSILSFLESDIGQRTKLAARSGSATKEQPFVMGVEEEGISGLMMIQGVIDLYFEEDGALVLVDYKTDYMKDVDNETLVERYKGQMGYYKQALEQSTGKKVKEIYLYSVGLQEAIQVL